MSELTKMNLMDLIEATVNDLVPKATVHVFDGSAGKIGVNVNGEFAGWINEGHIRKRLNSAKGFVRYLEGKLKL